MEENTAKVPLFEMKVIDSDDLGTGEPKETGTGATTNDDDDGDGGDVSCADKPRPSAGAVLMESKRRKHDQEKEKDDEDDEYLYGTTEEKPNGNDAGHAEEEEGTPTNKPEDLVISWWASEQSSGANDEDDDDGLICTGGKGGPTVRNNISAALESLVGNNHTDTDDRCTIDEAVLFSKWARGGSWINGRQEEEVDGLVEDRNQRFSDWAREIPVNEADDLVFTSPDSGSGTNKNFYLEAAVESLEASNNDEGEEEALTFERGQKEQQSFAGCFEERSNLLPKPRVVVRPRSTTILPHSADKLQQNQPQRIMIEPSNLLPKSTTGVCPTCGSTRPPAPDQQHQHQRQQEQPQKTEPFPLVEPWKQQPSQYCRPRPLTPDEQQQQPRRPEPSKLVEPQWMQQQQQQEPQKRRPDLTTWTDIKANNKSSEPKCGQRSWETSHAAARAVLGYSEPSNNNYDNNGSDMFPTTKSQRKVSSTDTTTGRANTSTAHFVSSFNVNDVLTNRKWMNHVGNLRYEEALKQSMDDYKAAHSKDGKVCVAERIISYIQEKGGQFLKYNGGWRVLDDGTSRRVVLQSLQDRMVMEGRNGTPDVQDPHSAPMHRQGNRCKNEIPISTPQVDNPHFLVPPVPRSMQLTAWDDYESIAVAIRKYETFHGLQHGTATVEDLKQSSAGVEGWASSVLDEGDNKNEDVASSSPLQRAMAHSTNQTCSLGGVSVDTGTPEDFPTPTQLGTSSPGNDGDAGSNDDDDDDDDEEEAEGGQSQVQYDDAVVEVALYNYECFYGLKQGSAFLEVVEATSAGVQGWAASVLSEQAQTVNKVKEEGSDEGGAVLAAKAEVVTRRRKGDDEEARMLQLTLLDSLGVRPVIPHHEDKNATGYESSSVDDSSEGGDCFYASSDDGSCSDGDCFDEDDTSWGGTIGNAEEHEDIIDDPAYNSSDEVPINKGSLPLSVTNTPLPTIYTFMANYDIKEELNEGVCIVVHKESGAERALKKTAKSVSDVAENQKVIDEFNVIKELDHPNILKAYELFEDDHHFYIVTEVCQNGDLLDVLEVEAGVLPEADAAMLIFQVVSGIKYCHKNNLIHCNLKPENILLEQKKALQEIKLIDFGCAAPCDEHTTISNQCGTAAYMSPQAMSGEPYGQKTDMWAIGVLAHICIYGFNPFEGLTDPDGDVHLEMKEFVLDDSPEWGPISENAKDFVKKCLAYEERDRLTATEALEHPWFHGFHASREAVTATQKAEQISILHDRLEKAVVPRGKDESSSLDLLDVCEKSGTSSEAEHHNIIDTGDANHQKQLNSPIQEECDATLCHDGNDSDGGADGSWSEASCADSNLSDGVLVALGNGKNGGDSEWQHIVEGQSVSDWSEVMGSESGWSGESDV